MDNIGLYKQKEEEEEEEQSFPRRNLSLAANLTGAGLVGGVGMSLPYMMGTDKEYDLSRAALGRSGGGFGNMLGGFWRCFGRCFCYF